MGIPAALAALTTPIAPFACVLVRALIKSASVPLDNHGWEALAEGTVLAIRGGEVLEQA